MFYIKKSIFYLTIIISVFFFCFNLTGQAKKSSSENDSNARPEYSDEEKELIKKRIAMIMKIAYEHDHDISSLKDSKRLAELSPEKLKEIINNLVDRYGEEALDKKMVLKDIEKIVNEIVDEKSDDPMAPTQFTAYARKIMFYAKHPLLEKELKIRKNWFVLLAKTINGMRKTHTDMKVAIMNKNKEKYLKAWNQQKKYKEALKKLVKAKNKYKVKKKKKKGGMR